MKKVLLLSLLSIHLGCYASQRYPAVDMIKVMAALNLCQPHKSKGNLPQNSPAWVAYHKLTAAEKQVYDKIIARRPSSSVSKKNK